MPSNPCKQAAARSVLQKADAVCFDVDSTVCKDEGLDELAEFCGVGKQVKEWTLRAMGGDVSFREALSERLKIVNPSLEQVESFVASRPPQLSEGIADLVALLQSRNIQVFLVSGGFRRIIEPAAQLLNIPHESIFANRLVFKNGQYSGFDPEEPTSESGGKTRVTGMLKEKFGLKNLVMIGDGATDMEASPPADAFIGYGGNVVRDKVKNNADWFVTDFQELISALQEAKELSS
ncbi:phosphoserine phosphatase-like [Littorina saxatilis]|uniref:Phosphoserine phosphatase n=1 Tax=Littorina saxatilis TaxID=31220 RepID=A0AAN9BAQ2_9CAEN